MSDVERRERIDDLCDAALDRDPAERAAFVAAACGSDRALLKEVEALLAQAPIAEGFLATPISAIAAQVFGDELRPSLAGRELGSYTVVSLIGSGGMGDVYRARDTKLGRDVAIKVLPDRFISVPGRLARFELEARVLAALNHPNVAAIYGAEEVDGIRALVLELVEGETLAERLHKGAVPLCEALEVARQVVNALEVAHENGIIHRDLKPANIKITPEGIVKVLDFGLAKVFATDESRIDARQALPLADHSRDGVIAGTTAYMSPEQARGQVVDKRTDIWAFGCVLFEMLTARPAFAGETTSDTVAAVLEHKPDLDALPRETPAGIRRLIQRCLEKDARRRLRDIGDARLEIDEAVDNVAVSAAAPSSSAVAQHPKVPVNPRSAAWLIALTVTAAALLLIAVTAGWNWSRSDSPWTNPLQDPKGTLLTDFEAGEHHAAISRDGKFVAFLSDRSGSWDVWVNQIGTGKVYNLTNGSAPELRNPATRALGFSPDGSRVSVWTRGGEGTVEAGWVIPTLGGPLQRDFKGISELDWSRDDGRRMVYHPPDPGDPLFVTEPGEKVGHQIYVARRGFHNHFPVWSHDGAFIYFVHGLPLDENDIWRIRPDGSGPKRMTFHNTRVTFPTVLDERTILYLATDRDGSGPWIYGLDIDRGISHRIFTGLEQYTSLAASADGRRVVATLSRPKNRLWRVPLGASVATESTPIPVPTAGGLSPRVAPGALVYRSPKLGGDSLWTIGADSDGRELWNGANGRVLGGSAIAPDGQRLAFVVQADDRTQLYVMNTDGTGTYRLAEGLDVRGSPAWSPDGRWLAIAVNRDGEPRLVKIPLDNGPPVPLVNEYSTDPTWSPSGEFLIYSGADVGTRFQVKAVRASGAQLAIPELILTRGARRLVLLREDTLLFMKGDISHQEFWSLNLVSGRQQQLTNLGHGFVINDFDVSQDRKEIVFDRSRDESDIALFELKVK